MGTIKAVVDRIVELLEADRPASTTPLRSTRDEQLAHDDIVEVSSV
jgi:hypothetical protein